jgi:hypothetical protein
MKLKISFIVSAAMLVVSVLTMGISIAPQPSEGAKGQYFLLGFGPDDQTIFMVFETKNDCLKGRKIAQQEHPDFVFRKCN